MKALYVHIPFCKDICAYCDFTRSRYHHEVADKWLVALQKELQQKNLADSIETIFIGGGTPTALSDSQFHKVLHMLQPLRKNIKEFSVEANVDSLSNEKIQDMKNMGVNRISIGVQTFDKNLLNKIARFHTIEEVKDRIDALHNAGIHNISLDFMYGLPGQTMKQWEYDLSVAIQLPIQHISLYALTIEKNSTFGRENIEPMDPTLEGEMYDIAIATLEKAGFFQYEISSFAKPGYECLHNQMYWKYEDFEGIGCGACGKRLQLRYNNTNNIQTYISEGPSPELIPLTKRDEMFEMVMMSLRMKKGLCLESFHNRFHESFNQVYKQPLQDMLEKEYLVMEEGYVKTTKKGMFFLHDVLEVFL